jgi:hypothetical protein
MGLASLSNSSTSSWLALVLLFKAPGPVLRLDLRSSWPVFPARNMLPMLLEVERAPRRDDDA